MESRRPWSGSLARMYSRGSRVGKMLHAVAGGISLHSSLHNSILSAYTPAPLYRPHYLLVLHLYPLVLVLLPLRPATRDPGVPRLRQLVT